MTLAPWRSVLARALHRNRARAYSRYLQLATLNLEGKPANRTVVFRGFNHDYLQMITDGRSRKVSEIQSCAWGEACWYFTITREQFRIAGQLVLVGPDSEAVKIDGQPEADPPDMSDVRLRLWQGISAKARQQFYWPQPGHPREQENALLTADQVSEHPPDSFYALLLQPQQVDYLNLKGTPQDRYLYRYGAGHWQTSAVNP